MSDPGLVSVVVIGRNEGPRLERCLRSVGAMELRSFQTEVIYVDSASTDGSCALAKRNGARCVSLTSTNPTAAAGRNAGWRMARGETILFLDGDTILAPTFVAESLAAFDDAAVAVVWGHRREIAPHASIYNRVLDLDWIYPAGDTPFCGGDALFRRSVLETTGGFDETLIAGEEPELCRRILDLCSRIVHVDRAMTGHDLAITRFGQYCLRAKRAGHAYAEVSERFRNSPRPFWLADAVRNRNHAGVLIGLPAVAVTSGVCIRSLWPVVLAAVMLALLAARSAWKARWRSREMLTCLLYGAHSHFQQIPIFLGQLEFKANRWRGRRSGLVEYKGT